MFYTPNPLIAFRLITDKQEDINIYFWEQRIEKAKLLRDFVYHDEKSYRVLFGESDGLPGVILDKYEDYICISSGAENDIF